MILTRTFQVLDPNHMVDILLHAKYICMIEWTVTIIIKIHFTGTDAFHLQNDRILTDIFY